MSHGFGVGKTTAGPPKTTAESLNTFAHLPQSDHQTLGLSTATSQPLDNEILFVAGTKICGHVGSVAPLLLLVSRKRNTIARDLRRTSPMLEPVEHLRCKPLASHFAFEAKHGRFEHFSDLDVSVSLWMNGRNPERRPHA